MLRGGKGMEEDEPLMFNLRCLKMEYGGEILLQLVKDVLYFTGGATEKPNTVGS